MAGGVNRKISAASARAHTRRAKQNTSFKLPSGIFTKILLVLSVGILAWAYQAIQPRLPKTCGSPDGPPVTASRVKLRDGRHLAYKEHGVPRDAAKYKIVGVHAFDSCRLDALTLSPEIVEGLGVYIVTFDRPGYGESDPNPKRTVKSMALDIEEFADQLRLGSKFYVIGYSMGGQVIWSCLKYIPHRLAGAALVAPAVNYWWSGFPTNLSKQAYQQQLPQDQWAFRVSHYAPWLTYWWNTQKWFPSSSIIAHSTDILSSEDKKRKQAYQQQLPQDQWAFRVSHYAPWLTYWWNTQKWFPSSSIIAHNTDILSSEDKKLWPKIISTMNHVALARQQGEYESLHRDLIIGFGTWEFSPMDLDNPFPNNEGSVHLWHGDEDGLVPVTLQRYIAQQLSWIHYHELPSAGHLFLFADGMGDNIVKALLVGEK